jgi:hypothetical protein
LIATLNTVILSEIPYFINLFIQPLYSPDVSFTAMPPRG